MKNKMFAKRGTQKLQWQIIYAKLKRGKGKEMGGKKRKGCNKRFINKYKLFGENIEKFSKIFEI